jgi:4-amino-4-deoxy-L-arabinose transferase-like glycosyltransferase
VKWDAAIARHRGIAAIVLLFAVGAGARLAAVHALGSASLYTIDASGYLLHNGGAGDEREYDGRAWNFVNGGSFWSVNGDGNAPPGMCLWIAAVYSIFGRALYVVLLGNAVFGGLTAVATYALARRIVSSGAAVVAGLGVAIDPQLVYWSTRILTETPAILIAALCSLALFKASGTDGTWRNALVLGVILGLGLTVRNNLVVFAVAAPIWWVLVVPPSRKNWQKFAIAAATFLVCASLLFAVVRSQRPPQVSGQVEQFWRSSAFRPHYFRVAAPEKALRRKGSALTDEELAQAYRQADAYIEQNPAWRVVASNLAYEFRRLWRIVPTGGSPIVRATYTIHAVTLFGLVLLGAVRLWSRSTGRGFVLYVFLATSGLSALHSMLLARPRYRLILEPLFWILAAEAVVWLYSLIRNPPRRLRPVDQLAD